MRYKIESLKDIDPEYEHIWSVKDTLSLEDDGWYFTKEAQAQITAFALNAVAEGKVLVSLEPNPDNKPEPGETWYDGPTDLE